MLRYAGNAVRRISYMRHVPDLYWSKYLLQYDIDPRTTCYQKSSGQVRLSEIDVTLDKDKASKHLFLLDAWRLLKALRAQAGAKVEIDSEDTVTITVQGVTALVETWEDVFILHELFVEGIYNLICSQPCVVCDIGMNVGFASLFFARQENVMAVHSFEPFPQTFAQAARNFALNAPLSAKIQAVNVGLSDRSEMLTVPYVYTWKGRAGVHGIPQDLCASDAVHRETTEQRITLRNACDVVDGLLTAHPGIDIVAKIDCEGSEYKILTALHASGQIHRFKAFLMEWHVQGPEPLVALLKKANFAILAFHPYSASTGMLYAVRS